MTEDQAKEKWCPYMQVAWFHYAEDSGAFSNRNESDRPLNTNCIASDCMAWRWTDTINFDVSDDASVFEGYCGLAGKP